MRIELIVELGEIKRWLFYARRLARFPVLVCGVALLVATICELGEFTAKAGFSVNQPAPKLFILSIGINSYPPGSKIMNPTFAASDAEGIASAFSSSQVRSAFSSVEVTMLLDSAATLSGIRSAFERFVGECKPQDVVLIYFGGQGRRHVAESGPEKGYAGYDFAAYDTAATIVDGPQYYSFRNALTARELSAWILSIQAQRQIVILDSFESAYAFDSLNAALHGDSVFTLRDAGRRFALIGTDGSSLESSEFQHGLMTAMLLRGMKGAADADNKGYITEADLEGYMMSHLGTAGKREHYVEELLSYSDLRGLCLSETASGTVGCDPHFGYDSWFRDMSATRAFQPELPQGTAATVDRGTDYALIVGSDKYDHWPSLSNPIYDVRTLERELVENFGYAQDHVVFSQNPTKRELHDAIAALESRSYDKNDRLLVYIAGHGYRDSAGEGFLVTRDTKLPAEDPYLDTGLDLSRLRSTLDQLSVPHILLVLDVCYGGSFKERKAIPTYTSQNLDSAPALDAVVANKMKAVSRLYIASGGLRQVFDGEPGTHSPFSRAFLRTMRNYGGTEHLIDMGKLDGAVYGLCPHPYYGTFGSQQEGGDFVFIPKPDAKPIADPGLDENVPPPHCSPLTPLT